LRGGPPDGTPLRNHPPDIVHGAKVVVAVRTDAVAEALTPTIAPARGLGAAKVAQTQH